MRLQDRVVHNNNLAGAVMTNYAQSRGGNNSPVMRRKKICWDFNSGTSTYGFGCRFDHRCGICGKLGHGAFNCRKLKQNKKSNNPRNDQEGYYRDNNKNDKMYYH